MLIDDVFFLVGKWRLGIPGKKIQWNRDSCPVGRAVKESREPSSPLVGCVASSSLLL